MGARGRRLAVLGVLTAFAVPSAAGAATIKVDTTDDNNITGDIGDCTLRDAVTAASTNAKEDGCPKGQASKRDVIKLGPREYLLSHPAGDVTIGNGGPITIRGKTSGNKGTEIAQTSSERLFDVFPGANATLQKLELRDGDVIGEAEPIGGIILADGAGTRLTLRGVEVSFGKAVSGGGIYVAGDTKLKVENSQIEFNSATESGGGLVTADAATATIRRSSLFANTVESADVAALGGAIEHLAEAGSMTIIESSLAINSATATGATNEADGGAIHTGAPLEIRRSILRGNEAIAETAGEEERGGAVIVTEHETEIVNSTFTDNTAGNGDGLGGAVFAFEGDATLQHTTLVDNLAADGGDSLATDVGTISFGRSIIDDALIGSPCDGSGITSLGFNVSEDDHADCGFVGSDLVNSSSLALTPLGSNGGPTSTVAIGGQSDAKNFVPKNECLTVTDGLDQRGFERPAGPKCDAGAYEAGAKKPKN